LRDHGSGRSSSNGYLWAKRKSPAAPLIVRVFPISNTRAETLGVPAQLVSAVVISEPGQQRPPPVGLLMGFYGLTRAEASVASAVAGGKHLAEIAALEGRSIHTVRAQLKACFARLAVRSQAELVRRLSALMY
jgi:DNA-binding CsgD family transcriptional regulator